MFNYVRDLYGYANLRIMRVHVRLLLLRFLLLHMVHERVRICVFGPMQPLLVRRGTQWRLGGLKHVNDDLKKGKHCKEERNDECGHTIYIYTFTRFNFFRIPI
jgi:hypothetical protein